MNSVTRIVGATLLIGTSAAILAASGTGTVLAQTFKPVMALIINDDEDAVPVRHVGPPLPVTLDSASLEPFSVTLSPSLEGSFLRCQEIVVPTGKMAVLEYLSVITSLNDPLDILLNAEVRTEFNDVLATAVPVTNGGVSGRSLYVASTPIRAYAVGTFVRGCLRHSEPTGSASFTNITVSGYLVDLP